MAECEPRKQVVVYVRIGAVRAAAKNKNANLRRLAFLLAMVLRGALRKAAAVTLLFCAAGATASGGRLSANNLGKCRPGLRACRHDRRAGRNLTLCL